MLAHKDALHHPLHQLFSASGGNRYLLLQPRTSHAVMKPEEGLDLEELRAAMVNGIHNPPYFSHLEGLPPQD
eukprot:680917-Amphidinium_carterae.1